MKKADKKNTSRGFTLIELLVVISIIGLLATIALASLSTSQAKARNAKRETLVRQYVYALELYRNDHSGYYPVATVPGNIYCLGYNNTSNNCFGASYSQDVTTSQLIAGLNPYFTGPPASNDSAIAIGFDFRGLTYQCLNIMSGIYCTKYTINWYLEAGETKCSGGGPTYINPGTLYGCQFISGGVNI